MDFRKAAKRGIVMAGERHEECLTRLRWEQDPEGMRREEQQLKKELLQRTLEVK
jgi:hypothetical protein